MAKKGKSKPKGKTPPVVETTGGDYSKLKRGWRRELTDKFGKRTEYKKSFNTRQHAL